MANLAGWPTPKAGTGDYQYSSGDHDKIALNLSGAAKLAGWATPTSRDYRSESATDAFNEKRWSHPRGKPLAAEVIGEHGPTSNGSPAATENPGQLNPAFSRWLQAFPPEWDIAAIRAHRLIRTLHRKRG
jgi:hypothetical protein